MRMALYNNDGQENGKERGIMNGKVIRIETLTEERIRELRQEIEAGKAAFFGTDDTADRAEGETEETESMPVRQAR